MQLEERTLLDFANNIISHQGSSIKSRLDNLHALVVPEKGGGILGNKGVIAMFANGIKVIYLQSVFIFASLTHFMYQINKLCTI